MESITELYQELEKTLNDISIETNNILELTKLSCRAVEAAMTKLKSFIMAHTFKDVQEEIYFFKELKPRFYARLIYFIRLFEIETKRPEGSEGTQRKFLKKQLAAIKKYSEDNIMFYKYYRSGATYMDIAYFTRDKFDLLVGVDLSYFDCDQAFCTSHDYKVAMLLANEQIVAYLSKSFIRLDNNHMSNKVSALEELGLHWAETKTAFVEMMYALQSLGAFYNVKTKAKADIKEIARFFEIVLEIDLGNYYRLYYDICLRKKEPTSFLDKMKRAFIKRTEEKDDHLR